MKRRKYRSHTILHDPAAECLKIPEVERVTRFGRKYIYAHLLRPGNRRRDAWIPTINTGTRSVLVPRRGLMEALAQRTTLPTPKVAAR